MNLEQRIHNISQLHFFLNDFLYTDFQSSENLTLPLKYYLELDEITNTSVHHNGWFIKENVLYALTQWEKCLTKESILQWTSKYSFSNNEMKNIGIIMAGNIPMVGFHDLLSVILAGHKALIKLSSNDDKLIPFFIKLLNEIDKNFINIIEIVSYKLENFDAVIATGSNNTARYFEYYFGNKPNIIRKNRTSVAVISGNETEKDLENLGEDILRYFGMGCRNVSKLFIPNDFNLDRFFKGVYPFQDIINKNKYRNNYDYHKAIFLMNQDSIIENGFLILKEDKGYHSPIGTLFYERYNDVKLIKKRLIEDKNKLQCIVGKGFINEETAFGETQKPNLEQYADGIDTLKFLQIL